MSYYMMTDQEKVDLVKGFAKRFAPWVGGLLILIVIGFGVFSYWKNHQEHRDYAAAQLYQSMLMLDSQNQAKAEATAETLIQDYSDLKYAHWAAFYLADVQAELHHFDEAKKQLNFVLNHTPTALARNLALLRLAQVAMESNDLSEAKRLLGNLDAEFDLAKNALLSDIYLLENQVELAREASKRVLQETESEPLLQDWFHMKLNRLPTQGR